MSRSLQAKTESIELLCGYLETNPDIERKDGETDEDFNPRKYTLHKKCVVKEMDHNMDRDLANRDVNAVDLLARHLVSVGNITDPKRLQEEVAPKLLKGDYDYALLRIRAITLTPIYKFKLQCTRRDCRSESDQQLDLDEIECVDMPDPYARRLTYETEDGISLVFRHFEAADIDILSDIVEDQEDELRQVLGLKFESMDGLTPAKSLSNRARKCKTPEQHVREAIRMLDHVQINHREREDIRKKLEKMVGYPKMLFRAKCNSCRASWQQRVQIGPSFFLVSSED